MNQVNKVIVDLIHYNAFVRDTLEYTLQKDSYNIDAYDIKKAGLTEKIKDNTPIKIFCNQNGEKGAELYKQLEKFRDDFYGENTTIIQKKSDGLRVDHAQNIKIFEGVMPIHESMNNIIGLHAKYAADQKQTEEKITNLMIADERFYRAVAFLTLSQAIREQFIEFNKAMKESQGQRTPNVTFIEQDINRLCSLLNNVKAFSKAHDNFYTSAMDSLFAYVETISGKRDVPEGKNFDAVYEEARQKIAAFVADAEAKFNEQFIPIIEEMRAEVLGQQKKA